MIKHILIFFCLIFFFACSSEDKEKQKQAEEKIKLLPASTGDISDVLIVLDSAFQKADFSVALDSLLAIPYQLTINPEASFHVSHVTNVNWDGFLKKRHLIIIPILTEELINEVYFSALGPDIIENINNGESAFVFAKDHVYAQDQRVVFLASKNQRTFLQDLEKQKEFLFNTLEENAEKRAYYSLFSEVKTKTEIEIKKRKVCFNLPKELSLEIAKDGFVWYRKADLEVSLNFCLSWMPLKDFLEIKDPVKYRNQELGKHLFANDDSASFMTTEMSIEPLTKTVDFLGEEAVETRGLWKLNTIAMGGSFVSMSFVDSQFKKFYYAEGFVYAPSKQKSDYLRAFTYLIKTIELK